MKRLKPAGGCIRGLMSLKQIGMVCFAFLFSIFSTNLFATGIDANASSASCDNPTLGTYSGTSNLQANWEANKINLTWYSDDTQITNVQSAATTCNYDGTLSVPSTPPTKTGYTFNGWKVRGLPSGYTRLQYIQSSGTQYINTGVFFTSPNVEIRTKVAISSTISGEQDIVSSFSSSNSTSAAMALGFYNNSVFLYSRNNSAKDTNASTAFYSGEAVITAKYDFSAGKKYLTVNGVTAEQTYSRAITSSTQSPVLFSNVSRGYILSAKMYYMEFYVDGELAHNFIPAKNSSNVVGMYDTVSKTFFTNAGSGTFTAGPVVQ